MTGARYSVGCGYLVATAGTDTKVEVAFGNFVSGGVAVGGEVVTHTFEGVVEGSLFRRRCTEQEAALADADWRLTKVRRDGTFHFELGMSDGVEGIVGAQRMSRHTRPRSSSASSTGRGCCRCRDPPFLQAAAAGADVAGLVGRSLRTEGQSIDAGVFGTLFSVLKACGASESADHVC